MIKELVKDIENELIDLRRYFHENPEKSWEEFNTQKVIMGYLDNLGIPYIKSTKTGVIATIKSAKESDKVIGIRADIDALPMTELSSCTYRSKNEGVMHACGHDAHITILLGVAKVLSRIKNELEVNVRLIFQPAEEFIEDSGAAYMKDEKLVLECDRIIALHIWSQMEIGYASLRKGPIMAAADTFDIFINGKGGHGALPHQAIDPIIAGSELLSSIQRIVSREVNPQDTSVISVTSFHSGTTSNVIPDSAHLMGTTRTFNNQLRDDYPKILERVIEGVGDATRTEMKLEYHLGTPALINDEDCVETGLKAAEKVFGKDKLIEYEKQMGGEDFAKYKNPKCLLFLGGGFKKIDKRFPQHNPYFDIDETALGLGVEYFVQYVMEYGTEV
ncbi:M20 metallopeptidase family protein [Anaerosphaera multitolerans]|uniref:Amidohydrolase n=1 Tax=Anaerosphaera multitolerans TaxID=2487351 RepID=A0A437S6Q9_9FIRM|nr:amidohydrolase [Anaerosphaera multitolerans]RVU54692.1 amidohydrolase [Anaerosphaera multitolerans]